MVCTHQLSLRMSTAAVSLAAKPRRRRWHAILGPPGFERTQKGPTRPRHGGALIDDATVSEAPRARQVDPVTRALASMAGH